MFSYILGLKNDTDTVLSDLLFSVCYMFSSLSYIEMGMPTKMSSVGIK